MDVLADTNILLVALQPRQPDFPQAWDSLKTLRRRGDRICIAPQILIEFWRSCTRPTDQNGLGLGVEDTIRHLARAERLFVVLPDHPEIFDEWKRLSVEYRVLGKQVHDTRLVACMIVHRISHILSFNARDFRRFREIRPIDPADVQAGRF